MGKSYDTWARIFDGSGHSAQEVSICILPATVTGILSSSTVRLKEHDLRLPCMICKTSSLRSQ